MRRGLKLNEVMGLPLVFLGFKPIPDEEGTETRRGRRGRCQPLSRFKPIPDEEGTETNLTYSVVSYPLVRFKPIPDEEGTET